MEDDQYSVLRKYATRFQAAMQAGKRSFALEAWVGTNAYRALRRGETVEIEAGQMVYLNSEGKLTKVKA